MTKHAIVLCVALTSAFLSAGCDRQEKSPAAPPESGIQGTVLGQRTGAWLRDRPELKPPIKPMANETVRVTDVSGAVVATTKTDGEGRFRINLPPGKYVVRANNPSDPGREESCGIEVQAGRFTEAVLPTMALYD